MFYNTNTISSPEFLSTESYWHHWGSEVLPSGKHHAPFCLVIGAGPQWEAEAVGGLLPELCPGSYSLCRSTSRLFQKSWSLGWRWFLWDACRAKGQRHRPDWVTGSMTPNSARVAGGCLGHAAEGTLSTGSWSQWRLLPRGQSYFSGPCPVHSIWKIIHFKSDFSKTLKNYSLTNVCSYLIMV